MRGAPQGNSSGVEVSIMFGFHSAKVYTGNGKSRSRGECYHS